MDGTRPKAIALPGLALKGQFLARLVRSADAANHNPNEQEVTALLPAQLLRMAREWRKDPEGVIRRLAASTEG